MWTPLSIQLKSLTKYLVNIYAFYNLPVLDLNIFICIHAKYLNLSLPYDKGWIYISRIEMWGYF